MNNEKKVNHTTAEFKARTVKLAVESNPPFNKTAEELEVNKNTLPTWIGRYHRPKPVEMSGVSGLKAADTKPIVVWEKKSRQAARGAARPMAPGVGGGR